MKTRIICGLVMAAVGIPILFLSEYIIYPIAVAALGVIAVWELLGLTGFRKKLSICIPSYLIVAALPILSFSIRTNEDAKSFLIGVSMTAICFMLYLVGYSVFKRGKVALADISLYYVFFVYVALAFTSISLIRYIPNGAYFYMLILLASWICDMFAYFVGYAIGKHKLIPEVSPKKTIEGAIGGVFFAALSFVIYGIVLTFIEGAPTPNYLVLGALGVVLSVISQMGDLSMSLLKREKGIKDFSNIFPGHGGVLDRFDSLLPVAPVLLVMCMIVPPFA